MSPRDDFEFYKDPEHLEPAGPLHGRLIRPGVSGLAYSPPECGPQTATVNTGSLRFFERAGGDRDNS